MREINLNPGQARRFLALSTFEGLIALVLLFRLPSEPGSAWLLGYSKARLLAAGFVSLGILVFGIFGLAARLRPSRFEAKLAEFDSVLSRNHHLLAVLISISLVVAGILVLLFLHFSPIAPHLGSLVALVDRLLFVLLWAGLFGIQGLALLLQSYAEQIRSSGFWDPGAVGRTLLLGVILAAAAFHWIVLIFRIQIFTRLPGWYWIFRLKEDEAGTQWIYVPLALVILGAGYWLMAKSRPARTVLPVLVGLGVMLQLGMGFVEAGSVEPVRLKYADSEHSIYAGLAADEPRILDVVGDYEARYADLHHVDTKPPGVLVFYVLTQRISNLIRPETHFAGRFERLTRLSSFIYPFISTLTLVPLYGLGRRILGERLAVVPGLLYIVSPNIVLIPLFLDQVLYPLLACTLCLWLVLAIERRALGWAAAVGALMYLALFFSFSLLPIGLMLALLGGLKARQEKLTWREATIIAAAFALGFLVLLLVFRLGYGYDMLVRYRASIAIHQANRGFAGGWSGFVDGLIISNLDFAVWVGFPIAILAFKGMLRSLRAGMGRKLRPADQLALAFLGTVVALNILGQTTSEVGRLWLYLVPMMVLIGGHELGEFENNGLNKLQMLMLIVLLQLVTVFLVFRFQDFAA